jgi:transitional endoplasmic reticulum ATPase
LIVQYAKFWQGKLKDNKDVEFPDMLCTKVAEITDKFSFAYMQEAFVASLLAIAVRGGKSEEVDKWSGPHDPLATAHVAVGGGEDPDLDHLELWVEMKKQVKILKEEMDEKRHEDTTEVLPVRSRVCGGSMTRYRDELDVLLHGRREEQQQMNSRAEGWRVSDVGRF